MKPAVGSAEIRELLGGAGREATSPKRKGHPRHPSELWIAREDFACIVGPEEIQVILCEGEQRFGVESEQRTRSQKGMKSLIDLRNFHAAAASVRLS